ncbi:hypothetical protein QJS04_geneDACA014418 [Acorus gramineus]|uniref:Uncharacterized protein n=1 Tax=Acorus gramineus TaxID=55184 RepID=A0AAV9BQB6_ACOGR|nr:hypothetical protein QJS04_geneDACA014418 [Acorus gramineus]
MGGITTAVIAIVAVALGWATIEIACKPASTKAGKPSTAPSIPITTPMITRRHKEKGEPKD